MSKSCLTYEGVMSHVGRERAIAQQLTYEEREGDKARENFFSFFFPDCNSAVNFEEKKDLLNYPLLNPEGSGGSGGRVVEVVEGI
mmetsp:Transcript_24411/g.39312  ORF Transcript_24411/g.39312 Transcript_24411/m.39312 type:complete len:85 (+) Transcript_24411:78-332(+)